MATVITARLCTYVRDPIDCPMSRIVAGQTTLQPYSGSEEHPRSRSLLLLIGLDS